MTTFCLNPRWAKMKDGTHRLLNKETDVKLKSLKNDCGTGYTWHIIWADGKEWNTLYSSRGKDSYRKSDLQIKFKN